MAGALPHLFHPCVHVSVRQNGSTARGRVDTNTTTSVQVPQAVASGLTVRVINNITKKLDVKPRFLETFKNDGFPVQFSYKQKVSQTCMDHSHLCMC